MSQPIIKILVGASKAQYFAHKSVLVDTSDFFRAALEGPWQESKGIVELQQEQSETFETYLQYAYCSKLFVRKGGDVSIPSGERGRLVNLYILADFLKAESLKNDIIDGLIDSWKERRGEAGLLAWRRGSTVARPKLLLYAVSMWISLSGSGNALSLT